MATATVETNRTGRQTPCATLFSDREVETFDALTELPSRIGRSSLLWIDIPRSSGPIERASNVLSLDPDTAHRLSEKGNAVGALDDRGDYAHLTAHVPAQDTSLVQVDCIVAERWVLTVRDSQLAVLESFHRRADGPAATGRLDGPEFMAMLLEWILGEYAVAFERIEDELEEMDVRALRGRLGDPEAAMRELVDVRRRIGSLHRALTSHRPALTALTHPELAALATERAADRFRGVLERFDLTIDGARDARSSIVSSFDVLMARTEHRTNQILKVLTLASVVFLPGALIAGVLGMNFKAGLFDHANLFWVVVAGIAGAIALTSIAAKRRHWV